LINFKEQEKIDSMRGALALREKIEPLVDSIWGKGLKNLCFLGIGGTWASCLQVVCYMKERTEMEVFAKNAAEYNTTGDRRIGSGTCVVISSVTGTTEEIVEAVKLVQSRGAEVIGFIDKADAELAKIVDHCITYESNEQTKFFITADRFMHLAGEMPEYEEMYGQFDRYLPEAIVAAEKAADEFARDFVSAHKDDALHYFVGDGTLYGATYSYAMCYWEEMHWLRTKSIHSAEFFHGMLEIVDKDTPVTLFVSEDRQRPLGERVAKFLPRICENYTIIDTKDYELAGISPEYRGRVSHLVMHAVTNRIDEHLVDQTGHDMSLRRYYRKMDY
jgi:fructoselysine-6-phosphate deglycase